MRSKTFVLIYCAENFLPYDVNRLEYVRKFCSMTRLAPALFVARHVGWLGKSIHVNIVSFVFVVSIPISLLPIRVLAYVLVHAL